MGSKTMLSFRPFMQNNKWMRNLKLLGIPEVSLKYVKEKKKREERKKEKLGAGRFLYKLSQLPRPAYTMKITLYLPYSVHIGLFTKISHLC